MSETEFTPAAFNRFLGENKLMGTRCKKCGAVFLPPRPICLECHSTDMEWQRMEGTGQLAAFTVIAVGPTAMVENGYDKDNPYCSGIVQVKEGPKISGQILGLDNLNPGSIKVGTPMTVEFVERKDGDIVLGFKAQSS